MTELSQQAFADLRKSLIEERTRVATRITTGNLSEIKYNELVGVIKGIDAAAQILADYYKNNVSGGEVEDAA